MTFLGCSIQQRPTQLTVSLIRKAMIWQYSISIVQQDQPRVVIKTTNKRRLTSLAS